ncbi:TniQ family protein [Pseudoalteromonas sp. APC 3356]|uniref:TniQ family protein n=1 Tax=Pseudoalteromonas sp. APC 3356 TaxID=3035185 RepID=UPI0025B5FE14|nr:TniQ family protein [Pseudoalteromonas sp. APC 3356]MDN3436178.1 TniQ family protein [Pseudoalteromonas sp. APC 3356]
MGTTNTRFTKNYRIKDSSIKTAIYPDESITSWLIRSALDCGTEPLVFTGFYWSEYRLWTYDLDRGFESIEPQIYTDITSLSINDSVKLQSHSLYSILYEINGENTFINGSPKWIIPRSSRNRIHHIGQFFCPYCLGEKSYLRNQWRLAWNFGCLKHNVLLKNKCNDCKTLYQPHLLSADNRHLNNCHKCGESLVTQQSTSLNQSQITALKKLNITFKKDIGSCLGHSVNKKTYFSVLRYFINLLRRAAIIKSTHAIALFIEKLNIKHEELCSPKTGLTFELLPLTERESLLINAFSIINLTKSEVVTAIEQSNITQKALSFEPYPKELQLIFEHALNSKVASPKKTRKVSTESIAYISRKWERIKRKLHIDEQ